VFRTDSEGNAVLYRDRGAQVTPGAQEKNNEVETEVAEGEEVITYAESKDGYSRASSEQA
jgi:hypothetical protein